MKKFFALTTFLVFTVTISAQAINDTTSINTEIQKRTVEANKLIETDKTLRTQLNAVKAALFDNSEKYNQLSYEVYQLEEQKKQLKQLKK